MTKRELTGTEESNPTKSIRRGINYLLVIGIDKYIHCPQLFNAVKDAKDLVQILKNRFLFEDKNITQHYDEEATKRNIFESLRSMAEKVTSNDSLIVYFSGHGEYDKLIKNGYWIPVDAVHGATDEYVPNGEVRKYLEAINSHHTFVIVDSCFSGKLFVPSSARNVSHRKERDPSRWGLTSGRNEIVEDGIKGTNSPFAKSLLLQLSTTDKSLGVAELCDKVLEVVAANAAQTPRGEPLRIRGHHGGQFVFHLKKNESFDWAETKKEGTLAAFQSFTALYPNGKYLKEAQLKIKSLSAEALWNKIEESSGSEIFELKERFDLINEYVDKYEDQVHYGEALEKGELLEYRLAFLNAKDSEFSLRRFLRKATPNVTGATAIKQKAQQILDDTYRNEKVSEIDSNEKKIEASTNEANNIKPTKFSDSENHYISEETAIKIEEKKEKVPTEKDSDLSENLTKINRPFQAFYSKIKRSYFIGGLIFLATIWVTNELISFYSLKPFQNTAGLYGYKKGSDIIIPAQFVTASKFKNGQAKVAKNLQSSYFVNENGECIKDCPSFVKNMEIGFFKDRRDGQEYSWVMLKDGKKWMTRNLNFETNTSRCMEDNKINCRKYGRLYNWSEAKNVCPRGWRLPSDDDWWNMTSQYGKSFNAMEGKEKNLGNTEMNAGNEAYELLLSGGNTNFNANLSGKLVPVSGFREFDNKGSYWTSNSRNSNDAWAYQFLDQSKRLVRFNFPKTQQLSCRCIQVD